VNRPTSNSGQADMTAGFLLSACQHVNLSALFVLIVD